MYKSLSFFLFLWLFVACTTASKNSTTSSIVVPKTISGDFKDDYDISYTINDSVWIQHPNIKYYLLHYDSAGKYFIVKNDRANPSEAGLYSRIDFMPFSNMEPWLWGFCLTTYNAKTFSEALLVTPADRNNPRKGCGGFPFSRMKRVK